MQTCLKTLVALVALAVAWQLGRPQHPASRADTPVLGERPSPRPVPEGGQYRGMAIQLHCYEWEADVYEAYHHLIPEIVNLGADTVLFVVHGWQAHAGSLDLRIDGKRTARTGDLGRLLTYARDNGLRTILMPIVLLSHPRNSEWRGQIIPPNNDWDAWFKRYTRFINHFARIAERYHVSILMIGSELIKAEKHTDRWRRLIAEVRHHYRGKLGYSANWDHYQTDKIGFWPDLDCVGMTTYYKLANGPNPQIDEIIENWQRIRAEIQAFQKTIRKPIVFTEVGWCSQEGAAKEAWNYYANQNATNAAMREQARLYEAFIRTWADQPGVGGIIWWEWNRAEGGLDDYNYTPRGKPAEHILRAWFAGKPVTGMADEACDAAADAD